MKIELDFKPISEWVKDGDLAIFYDTDKKSFWADYIKPSIGKYDHEEHFYFAPVVLDPKDFEIAALKKKVKELEDQLSDELLNRDKKRTPEERKTLTHLSNIAGDDWQ